jgi:hypothetical protein
MQKKIDEEITTSIIKDEHIIEMLYPYDEYYKKVDTYRFMQRELMN